MLTFPEVDLPSLLHQNLIKLLAMKMRFLYQNLWKDFGKTFKQCIIMLWVAANNAVCSGIGKGFFCQLKIVCSSIHLHILTFQCMFLQPP